MLFFFWLQNITEVMSENTDTMVRNKKRRTFVYDGEHGTCEAFIMQCSIYFEHLTCPPDHIMVFFIKTLLRGRALQWDDIIFKEGLKQRGLYT
uniref:Uncharacterized protein n=1 Tax=Astyanax mexicanus TaxID=7994 RepID=A0A8B9JVQ6_ASTMX